MSELVIRECEFTRCLPRSDFSKLVLMYLESKDSEPLSLSSPEIVSLSFILTAFLQQSELLGLSGPEFVSPCST